MKCKEFQSLIDFYLEGNIEENKREIFEEHYFLCDKCYLSLKISEILHEKKVRILPKEKKRYAIAFKPAMIFASFLLIVLSSLFIIDLKENNIELVKISKFSPPVFVEGENRGSVIPDIFSEAMDYYKSGKYKKAGQIISSVEKGSPKIWFFSGIIALINGNNNKALRFFNFITDKMDPSYYDEAVFYKGICYLRMKKKKDAIREFETLKTMYSHLSNEASQKLKLLRKL